MKNESEKWENIITTLRRQKNGITELLTDDDQRVRVMFFAVFLIFAAVSSVMTVVNIFTHWHLLMVATLVFAVANIINVYLVLICRQTEYLARVLFAVELTALFTYFLISGEPEGFSAIWIVLLPACGLLLYRMKFGLLISSVNFLILIFLLWTGPGRSLLNFEYTDSFMLRFPLLYIASFGVGLFFEATRAVTNEALIKMRHNYELLSKHDSLTRLYNRLGFYSVIGGGKMFSGDETSGFAIVDFDNFKTINDSYGHMAGDTVLKDASEIIAGVVDDSGCVCRWGGDEISVFFYGGADAESLCRRFADIVRGHRFRYGENVFRVTVSIGLTTVAPDSKCGLNELILTADKNLYSAKESGKDNIFSSEYEGE